MLQPWERKIRNTCVRMIETRIIYRIIKNILEIVGKNYQQLFIVLKFRKKCSQIPRLQIVIVFNNDNV